MFYFDEDHTEHGFSAPPSNVNRCTQQREITNNHDQDLEPSRIATVGGCFFDQRGLSAANFAFPSEPPTFRSSVSDTSLPTAFGKIKLQESDMHKIEEINENFGEMMPYDGDFDIVKQVLAHDGNFSFNQLDFENGARQNKQFILGDDDDEFLSEESDSDGGTAGFPLDEDSGIGFSAPDSVSDEAECMEQPSELLPLRSLNIGSIGRSVLKSRRRKLQFQDFYKLTDDHLGAGAYASVCTAVQISTGNEYAVKLVDKHERGHTRSRIMREVDTFNMCKNHPNIVQLIEWFEDPNFYYLVFEKMRGGPLLAHIQRKGIFTELEASQVTKDIVTALKFLHDRGIAHRDVKPENILCTDPERVSPVKLCDLDLASKPQRNSTPRLPSVHSEPNLASPVGSAEFMAPEVVDTFVGDALKYDKRCDMWSVGVIIYIMLCGYPPFYGECHRENCGWDQGEPCDDCQDNLFHRIQRGKFEFPEEEWADISDEAKDLISHLLVKNVRKRYTADDVLKHPWIAHGAPKTPLSTPNILFRNDSTRDVHQINEHFNMMSRFTRLSSRSDKSDESSGSSPPLSTNLDMPPTSENFDANMREPAGFSRILSPSCIVPSKIIAGGDR